MRWNSRPSATSRSCSRHDAAASGGRARSRRARELRPIPLANGLATGQDAAGRRCASAFDVEGPEQAFRFFAAGARVVTAAAVHTRVLVVDDNVDVRETLRVMLELSGFEVATAAGGETAIEMARSYRPDAVVMDLSMPGVDGFAAAKRLRAEPEFDSLALISLSALPVPDAAGWSRRAGFDYHLTKPADPTELVETLVRAAGARRKAGA